MSYKVKIDNQEGMLIDWILTMHSYNSEYAEYVMNPTIQNLRYQAGRAIISETNGVPIDLSEDDIKWLLAIIPVTFRFGRDDVGYSLKNKLYKAFLNLDVENLFKEVNNAAEKPSESTDETNDQTGT